MGGDATAKSFPKHRSDLAQKVLTALEKRYSDHNSDIVNACQVANFKSWPEYENTDENESVRQGINTVDKHPIPKAFTLFKAFCLFV